MARARTGLGILLKKSNRSVEAEALLRSAMADRKALVSENPDNADDGRALAFTRYQLGTLLARLKDRGAEDESAYLRSAAVTPPRRPRRRSPSRVPRVRLLGVRSD